MICNYDGIIISKCPGCHGLPKHHTAGRSSAAWHSARNRRCSASRARCHASVDVGGTYINICKLMYFKIFKRQYFAPQLPVLSILECTQFQDLSSAMQGSLSNGEAVGPLWLTSKDWCEDRIERWWKMHGYLDPAVCGITDIHWYHEW